MIVDHALTSLFKVLTPVDNFKKYYFYVVYFVCLIFFYIDKEIYFGLLFLKMIINMILKMF